MFGEKARRIEALEQHRKTCEEGHGPYIPLALEIGQKLTAASANGSFDVEKNVDRVVKSLTEEKAQELALKAFNELPAQERFDKLSEAHGDETTQKVLAHERNRLLARSEFDRQIDELEEDGYDYKWIDLQRVPEGARMSLSLYTDVDYKFFPNGRGGSPRRGRQIEAVSLGAKGFQILRDAPGEEVHLPRVFCFSDHEIVKFGKPTDGNTLDEKAYLGSTLCYRRAGERIQELDFAFSNQKLVVGELEVADRSILYRV